MTLSQGFFFVQIHLINSLDMFHFSVRNPAQMMSLIVIPWLSQPKRNLKLPIYFGELESKTAIGN